MAWVTGKGFITTRDTSNSSTLVDYPSGIAVREIIVSNTTGTARALILESEGVQIWDAQVAANGSIRIPVFTTLTDVEVATGHADLRITVFLR